MVLIVANSKTVETILVSKATLKEQAIIPNRKKQMPIKRV
jgi:hypothetical protein